jgi:deoxyuridine 5'-triphosphate nucleotidohydrolase
MVGIKSDTRPLLASFSGGLYDAHEVELPDAPRPIDTPLSPLPAGERGTPLGRGAWVVLSRHPQWQTHVETLAKEHQLAEVRSAVEASELIDRARGAFESDDAVVLALFAGPRVTRYAVTRAKAEGALPTLEVLARQLPPHARSSLEAASSALMLGTAYGLSWPVAPGTRITSGFGVRTHPTLQTSQFHTGIDLAVSVGTRVKAVSSGVVRRASEDAVNGRVVVIDHGHGVSTAYCHNQRMLVSVGQRVAPGQVISESGNTGRSTGPHLHYQIELGRRPVDPLVFQSPDGLGRMTRWPQDERHSQQSCRNPVLCDVRGRYEAQAMNSVNVRIRRVRDNADLPLPKYQSPQASGLDLLADVSDQFVLAPMARALIPTGLSIELPAGCEGQVRPRSGLAAKHGVTCLNTPGTIDADYRGEVKVLLVNLSEESYTIRRGDRIAQLVIAPVMQAVLLEVDALSDTARGSGGFGSTGTTHSDRC